MLQGAIISGAALSPAVIRDMVPAQRAASQIGLCHHGDGGRADAGADVCGVAVLGLCWVDLGETNKTPSETFIKQFRSYPELFRSRRFWGYALCMALSTGSFYLFLAGAPLVAETVFALSPATLGFCLGTITAGFMLGNFLSGRYAKRYPLTAMMISGRIVACTALMVGLGLFLAGFVHVTSLFGAAVFVGLGNG